jgi:hypothetical protein
MITNISSKNYLSWEKTPQSGKPEGYGWSEDGLVDNKVYYRLYFSIDESKFKLHDLTLDQYYVLPSDEKYRGYIIAFKLNTLRMQSLSKSISK